MLKKDCRCVEYTIKKGDTLYKISRRYNIELSLLLRANLNSDVYNLIPGQKICIPLLYDMKEDKLSKESAAPTNDDNVMFANEINATRKHLVGEGETIEMIMDMYNVSIEDLFKYNNKNGLILKEDQVIFMP